jgi:hypothetical protein
MTAYTDSDWGGDKVRRKSTSGWLLFIGSALINWMSKGQSVIAQSSSEAEVIAENKGSNEVVYRQNLFYGAGVLPLSQHETEIYIDNSSAIDITINPIHFERTKHIEIPPSRCRQLAETRRIIPRYIPTAENSADIMTKAVGSATIKKHCYRCGLR